MWKVCLKTFRNNRICQKLAYFLRNLNKLHGEITRELLGLRMRSFQGIAFTRRRTYIDIFKSALVYLEIFFGINQ